MEDVKHLKQNNWLCAVCKEKCRCKKCKLSQQKDHSSNVISYIMKGERVFQIDNFLIMEKELKYENQVKAKQEKKSNILLILIL